MNNYLEAAQKARREAEIRAKTAQAELAAFHDKQARGKWGKLHADNAEFVENLIREGRLMPRDRALFVHALDFAEMPETCVEFSEYDNGKSLNSALRERLDFYLK